MKHLLTLSLLAFFIGQLAAQPTIVSTTAENRNVLIEEYTGIHCGYCPNGHSYANQVLAAHPSDAYVINIHQGSYAVPSAGEPDFRTAYGDALAGQTGLGGYPAGTVNRHVFSGGVTDVDYTTWPTVANTVLAMSSPVNIAIDVNLDYATRELTVLVEVYYTANSAASTNKLNVAILQDWIKGPQSNYGNYNAAYITPDGKYWHMHMLRELLTGQWGITIPTTTAGTFWDSTFTYTVPATLGNGNIPVELPNLQIVAFVTEGNQEVLNATGQHVPAAPIDASVTALAGFPTELCATSFTPSVTVTNKGSNTLTSFDIIYSLDGGANATYNWTGSLDSGMTTVVNLPNLPFTISGTHTFVAATDNPNAVTDYNTVNDSYSETFAAFVGAEALPVSQAFTSTSFPPTGMAYDDNGGDGKNWSRGSAGHSAAGSAFINFFSISSGQKDDLFVVPLDFSSSTAMAMTFYVAYRQYDAENDKLQVDVSTDCGTTWSTKWTKSGSSLSTGAATTSSFSSPTAGEWRQEIVDLSAYDGESEVLIRFRATSAYGNNLFLDDINIAPGAAINEEGNISEVNVYPNPANDFTTISINTASAENAVVVIVNTLGEVVYNSSSWLNAGSNSLNVNTASFENGVYFVRIQSEGQVTNSSFVVGR